MKASTRVGLALALLLSALALTGFTWSAAQSQAMLRVNPRTLEIRPGRQASFDLEVLQVSGLYGAEIHIAFDPQLLEVVDAEPSEEGVQIEPGTFPSPDFLVRNAADNEAGTIDYAVTQLPPSQPGDGEGTVARVTFRAKATGTSRIQIDQFLLADYEGGGISAIAQHGQVTVENSSTRTLVTAIGIAALVLIGGGIGFVITRRK